MNLIIIRLCESFNNYILERLKDQNHMIQVSKNYIQHINSYKTFLVNVRYDRLIKFFIDMKL